MSWDIWVSSISSLHPCTLDDPTRRPELVKYGSLCLSVLGASNKFPCVIVFDDVINNFHLTGTVPEGIPNNSYWSHHFLQLIFYSIVAGKLVRFARSLISSLSPLLDSLRGAVGNKSVCTLIPIVYRVSELPIECGSISIISIRPSVDPIPIWDLPNARLDRNVEQFLILYGTGHIWNHGGLKIQNRVLVCRVSCVLCTCGVEHTTFWVLGVAHVVVSPDGELVLRSEIWFWIEFVGVLYNVVFFLKIFSDKDYQDIPQPCSNDVVTYYILMSDNRKVWSSIHRLWLPTSSSTLHTLVLNIIQSLVINSSHSNITHLYAATYQWYLHTPIHEFS